MNGWLSSLRIPRLVVSVSLVLWVSGAGCLIGCENMAMAAADGVASVVSHDSAAVVTGESCAMKAAHSCCAKHRGPAKVDPAGQAGQLTHFGTSNLAAQSTPAYLLPTSDGSMQMCPLALNASALATKARPDESATVTALAPVVLPPIDIGLTVAQSPPPAWLSNRGHTYLRCCVFLI